MSEDYKPIGSEPLPDEEQPDESMSGRSEVTQFLKKGPQAVAKRAATAGWTKTASFFAAFGPETIAFLLFLASLIAIVASLYLLICTGQSCQGTRPINASDPANNKQDALNLKDIICLNTAITNDSNHKGKLPQTCVEPIQARAKLIIANAESIKSKIPKNDQNAAAAIKILDALIAAAKKAEKVKADMNITEVQKIREEITIQGELASTNTLILKQRGVTPNGQIIVNYVQSLPKGKCRQEAGQCGVKADEIIKFNFPGAIQSDYNVFGGLVPDLPTAKNIQDVQDQLTKGNIPVWQVRGNGVGKHFIVILGIDADNNITYFDPADGSIKNNPYDMQDKWGPYFGTPKDGIGRGTVDGNQKIRGYYFTPTKTN